jgi:hypothetical protein
MWVGVCSSLNMVAFAKIMKKYDKVGRHRFGPLYIREVEHSYFATSDKVLEDISQAVGRTSWPPVERILFNYFWCIDGDKVNDSFLGVNYITLGDKVDDEGGGDFHKTFCRP